MTQTSEAAITRSIPGFAEFVAMMAVLMGLTALSIDVMLPALPQIRDEFGLADPNRQQLVVVSYMVGFAAGQLVHGPLSDWLGRKPLLLAGLAIYAAACFACVVVGSFELFLLARCIQGLANAAPRVVGIAVVRDIYGGRRMSEVMSFVMMVFIVVPVVAPSAGSAFLLVGSWHLIFAFLGAVGVATILWLGFRLPETRGPDKREPLSPSWLAEAFAQTARNRCTLGYTLATGVIFGSMMAYINSAQQVFVEVYALGRMFPLAFSCVAIAMAVASFVNSRLVLSVGMRVISHGAVVGFVVVALVHVSLDLALGRPPLVVFLLLLAASLFCFGLIMPNFNAIAMEPMGRIAGTASSFIGATTTGLGALIGLYIGQAFDGTVGPLLAGFALCGLVSFGIVLVTERGRLFRPGH
jgi:DHA1 family bicyclomycin/chloramphenicol resistance-like MFS transporter